MSPGIRKKRVPSIEMDLKPFMNLMVVLIPMLLLSAEFARVAVIDIKLPEGRGVQEEEAKKEPNNAPKDGRLLLTAIITDSAMTISAKGGFLPSIRYREFHQYVAKDDHTEFTVEYAPDREVTHPISNRPMSVYERGDILLYCCDENRAVMKNLYTRYGEMVTDIEGKPLASVRAGDSVYTVSNPRRLIVVRDPAVLELKPLSAYDELRNRLLKIKERFSDAEDRDKIIIAAENGVIYDKIVQLMDSARSADFPDISISKLRS